MGETTLLDTISSDLGDSIKNDHAPQNQTEMDEEFWVNASPSAMAEHISLQPKLTEYANDRETQMSSVDKMTTRYIDQLDTLDPNLSQDMTSEYMNV